jgi:hypothetical protein
LPDQRLQTTSASHGASPTSSLYVRAIAFSKIAALEVGEGPGEELPTCLRFNGQDGFDEANSSGQLASYVINGEFGPEQVAQAFMYFMPYLLLAPAATKDSLALRIYISDADFQIDRSLDGARDHIYRRDCLFSVHSHRNAFDQRDKALWDHAEGRGVNRLFDEFWATATVVYRDDNTYVSHQTAHIHGVEFAALERLAASGKIVEEAFADALEAIHGLISEVEVALGESRTLPVLDRADVRSGLLLASHVAGDSPAFAVLNRGGLALERAKPKVEFVARPPTWADVVDGANSVNHLIERSQATDLSEQMRSALIRPLTDRVDARLQFIFVILTP